MPTIKVTEDCTKSLQLIADKIARSRKTIVVTGAGISTNCGIPDFRSADGLYNLVKTQYPNAVVKGRDLFDSVLFTDPTSTALFYTFLASLRNEILKVQDTTAVHKFIKTLAESGRLLRCYTQNIDGLEEREGLITNLSCGRGKRKRPTNNIMVEDERTQQEKGCQVVQLHGELRSLRCTQCHNLTSYTPDAVSMLMSGSAPSCPACEIASEAREAAGKRATKVGYLRPNIVLYGEEHPEAEAVGKLSEADIRAAPDMMIILGTSLKVHGLKKIVKEFAKAVHAKDGIVVFVNNTAPTESMWRDVIDYHVDMDCDAWVTDIKVRRVGIWERQTKLPISKVVKSSTHENCAVKARKIAQPSTPSAGRRKPLSESTGNAAAPPSTRTISTPLTPPSTIKRRGGRMNTIAEVLEAEVQKTPSKPAKKKQKMAVDDHTPPLSPQITRIPRLCPTIAVEITSPAKRRVDLLKIIADKRTILLTPLKAIKDVIKVTKAVKRVRKNPPELLLGTQLLKKGPDPKQPANESTEKKPLPAKKVAPAKKAATRKPLAGVKNASEPIAELRRSYRKSFA